MYYHIFTAIKQILKLNVNSTGDGFIYSICLFCIAVIENVNTAP